MVRVHDISREFHVVAQAAARAHDPNPELARVMSEAHGHLLRAETSCNFYWGEAWVHKSHTDLDSVAWHLGEAKAILGDRLISLLAPAESSVAEITETVESAEPAEPAEPAKSVNVPAIPVENQSTEESGTVKKPV
jgi:hypothetical protein